MVPPAAEKAAAAEKLAAEARAAARAAETQLEAANKVVAAAETEARRLEEEVHGCADSNLAQLALARTLGLSGSGFRVRSRACAAPRGS